MRIFVNILQRELAIAGIGVLTDLDVDGVRCLMGHGSQSFAISYPTYQRIPDVVLRMLT